MHPSTLLADNEINRWLDENPLVLGGGILAIGLLLTWVGVRNLITGKARNGRGYEVRGGMAQTHGVVRLVAGVVLLSVGCFVLVKGML